MVIRARENLIGAWAFLIGIILAILIGIFTGVSLSLSPVFLLILSALGLVVGYFVAEKDVNTFLFASVAVVFVSFAGVQGIANAAGLVGVTVSGINFIKIFGATLSALVFLFVPATIIVALKTVFSISKS